MSIVVRAEDDGEAADLSVSMSPAYPGTSPPSYQLSAPFLTSEVDDTSEILVDLTEKDEEDAVSYGTFVPPSSYS